MLEHDAKITDNFHYTIRSHSCTTLNRHLLCSKEGKRDTKEDNDARTVATVDGKKAPLGQKRRRMVKKTSP